MNYIHTMHYGGLVESGTSILCTIGGMPYRLYITSILCTKGEIVHDTTTSPFQGAFKSYLFKSYHIFILPFLIRSLLRTTGTSSSLEIQLLWLGPFRCDIIVDPCLYLIFLLLRVVFVPFGSLML